MAKEVDMNIDYEKLRKALVAREYARTAIVREAEKSAGYERNLKNCDSTASFECIYNKQYLFGIT